MDDINRITGEVVGAAYRLHTQLGPGLLESAYALVLTRVLEEKGVQVEREKPIAFTFDGIQIENGFRVDLLVGGCVVVELKSVETVLPVHCAQVLTYLRLTEKRVGLLLNFNVSYLRQGVRRIVNNF